MAFGENIFAVQSMAKLQDVLTSIIYSLEEIKNLTVSLKYQNGNSDTFMIILSIQQLPDTCSATISISKNRGILVFQLVTGQEEKRLAMKDILKFAISLQKLVTL